MITESKWKAELERLGVMSAIVNVDDDAATVEGWSSRIADALKIGRRAAVKKFDEMLASNMLVRVSVPHTDRCGRVRNQVEFKLNRPAKGRCGKKQ